MTKFMQCWHPSPELWSLIMQSNIGRFVDLAALSTPSILRVHVFGVVPFPTRGKAAADAVIAIIAAATATNFAIFLILDSLSLDYLILLIFTALLLGSAGSQSGILQSIFTVS